MIPVIGFWDIKRGKEFIAKGAGHVRYKILHTTPKKATVKYMSGGKSKMIVRSGVWELSRLELPKAIERWC